MKDFAVEEVVARTRTTTTGVVRTGPVGKPPPARSTSVVGSTKPNHPRTHTGDRTGSRAVSGSTPLENTSWRGRFDGAGVRAHSRRGRTLSLRQAGCELLGAGAVGEVEWKPQALRSYYETRKFHAALSSGRGCAGNGP